MAVGFSQAKVDVDTRAGNLCVQLRDTLENIQSFNAFLIALGESALQALGYTQGEATAYLSNFAVLDEFRQVFQGLLAIPSAVNIQQFAYPYVGVS